MLIRLIQFWSTMAAEFCYPFVVELIGIGDFKAEAKDVAAGSLIARGR